MLDIHNKETFPYRHGVIAAIIDANNEFLITQLVDYSEHDWRFAGGGVEKDETPQQALLRELEEELGTTKFKILKRSTHQIKYDWPVEVIEKRIKRGEYFRGQIQDQFLVSFEGNRDEIKPDPKEIRHVKWVAFSQLKNHFNFPHQWEKTVVALKELLPVFDWE